MPPEANPVDPAAAANALADQFYAASRAVDDLRVSFIPPSPHDTHLRELADALETQAQFCTAAAVGATLARLQPDLVRIQTATELATAQLNHLKAIDKVITLATALLGVGTAVVSGDPATILAATQGLLTLV